MNSTATITYVRIGIRGGEQRCLESEVSPSFRQAHWIPQNGTGGSNRHASVDGVIRRVGLILEDNGDLRQRVGKLSRGIDDPSTLAFRNTVR